MRVDTVVRLLDPSLLLPAIGDRAHTLAQSAAAWSRPDLLGSRAPVLAALATDTSDAHVLRDAAAYADRRGLDLEVLEVDGTELARRLVERSSDASLVFLAKPRRESGRHGPVVEADARRGRARAEPCRADL